MGIFLIVLVFMLTMIAAMSIGVILGRKPIAGSCGGMSALGMESSCEICGGDKNKCEKESAKTNRGTAAALSYDATAETKV